MVNETSLSYNGFGLVYVDKVIYRESFDVKLDIESLVCDGFVLGLFEGDFSGLVEVIENQNVFVALRKIVLKITKELVMAT